MAKDKYEYVQRIFTVTRREQQVIAKAWLIEGTNQTKLFDRRVLRYLGKVVAEHCRRVVQRQQKEITDGKSELAR